MNKITGLITVTAILLILIYFLMTQNIRRFLPGYVRTSTPFGPRVNPISKAKEFHNGIDLAAPKGTPVYAYNDGIVTTFSNSLGGNQITIQGKNYRTGYAHLNDFTVKSGQTVKQGDLIGHVGLTGQTTGAHLHFTYYVNKQYQNPEELFKS